MSKKLVEFFLGILTIETGANFQAQIDVGSSTVARGVVSLVLGYLNNLVVEMAFLIQVKAINKGAKLAVLVHSLTRA